MFRPVRRICAALLPVVGLAVVPGTAGAAPVRSATATGATPLGAATDLGPADPTATLWLSVAVPVRDPAGLKAAADAHRHLDRGVVAERFLPTAAAADVASALRTAGFTEVAADPSGLLVRARTTVAGAESFFATRLDAVRLGGRSYVADVTAPTVPAALGAEVLSVLGLSTLPTLTAASVTAGAAPVVAAATTPTCVPNTLSSTGRTCAYPPPALAAADGSASLAPATSTAIAVFAAGDITQVLSDLASERSADGLTPITPTVVTEAPAGTDTSGVGEFDLDTQVSAGVAGTPGRLVVYDATALDDADVYASFVQFTKVPSGSTVPLAQLGSASFGECESTAQLSGALAADDQALQVATVQDQTVFAATGDDGGQRCPGLDAAGQRVPLPGVSYPASSPYVVAVGGTSLTTPGTTAGASAWSGGGGGLSTFEAAPAYQSGPTASAGRRTLPDVSADADPEVSPAAVIVHGSRSLIGGTSLSSPMVMGEWARLETAAGNGLGFADPLISALATHGGVIDVTSGTNGAYPATTGYDLATGVGELAPAIDAGLLAAGAAPPPTAPEAGAAVALPVAALVAGGWALRRRRGRR